MKGEIPDLKYDSQGLVPAVVQDHRTGAVLMVAYMNRESLAMTLETGYTHFWSRSRRKFWKKGETSGHVQKVLELRTDCDRDTLLVSVHQTGPACHTNSYSCFFNVIKENGDGGPEGPAILDAVHKVIQQRKDVPREGSYVSALMAKGQEGILEKIVEEAEEVVRASRGEGEARLVEELADLWFHTLVLLGWHQLAPDAVFAELRRRFRAADAAGA